MKFFIVKIKKYKTVTVNKLKTPIKPENRQNIY